MPIHVFTRIRITTDYTDVADELQKPTRSDLLLFPLIHFLDSCFPD